MNPAPTTPSAADCDDEQAAREAALAALVPDGGYQADDF